MLAHLIAALWVAAGGTVAGAVVAAVKRYGGVLLAKESTIKNTELRDALEFATSEAENAAQTIVVGLNQDTVAALKASGQWNAATAASVKAQALTLIEGTLSADSRAVLTKAMANLPGFLSALTEAQVAAAPNKTTASAATPTPAAASPPAPVPTPV